AIETDATDPRLQAAQHLVVTVLLEPQVLELDLLVEVVVLVAPQAAVGLERAGVVPHDRHVDPALGGRAVDEERIVGCEQAAAEQRGAEPQQVLGGAAWHDQNLPWSTRPRPVGSRLACGLERFGFLRMMSPATSIALPVPARPHPIALVTRSADQPAAVMRSRL